ncbi:MAG: glutamyl-tRNA synthetase [Candidatus Omnitrophota bacterium]|jgi:glutamyl-tRNA synthetase
MKVKTRFAPSPTGFLHVGSARTALFNWVFARHMKGEFILRIEDTDKERSKPEFEEEILESLRWLGMDWDGELTHQSKRNDIYKKYADDLLAKDLAYAEGTALRFRSPKEVVGWEDVVRGHIEFDTNLMDDLVIMKSDGGPTYNFACVVDDGEMGITHIVRGEDHISNTPKQIPLYGALGFTPPKFAHIPLILGEDRSRLSKRHGATSIREFRDVGYLSEAMVNYLSLLGWSPGNNEEVITKDAFIEKFTLERVLSTGAIFNIDKMDWMNGEYIRQKPLEELKPLIVDTLINSGIIKEAPEAAWMDRFVELYRKRIFILSRLPKECAFFFTEDAPWDEEGQAILDKAEGIGEVFTKYADALEALESFDHDTVEKTSREIMKSLGLSGKKFIHPSRVAITGRLVSPGFFETVSLLGKERACKRLRNAAKLIQV